MFVLAAAVLLLSAVTGVASGDCVGSNTLLTESKGQLASPAQGGSGVCAWQISVPKDLRIIFYFQSYNIDSSISSYRSVPECSDQDTRIELKDSPTDPPWRTYCERNMPEPITTDKSVLFVQFKLPKSDSKSWFTAEYITFPFEHEIDLRQTSSAEITSPNFPGKYPRNSFFKWSIVAPAEYRVKIEFTKFDISRYYSKCPYDALIVRDGPTDEGEQLARLCGDASDGQPIFASGSSMRLEFVSAMVSEDDDDNIGFKATLSKEVKLYVIAIPCALGVLLVGFLLGAIVLLRRRRSSSGATHPRMQMSLLKDTIHMSDADPPNAASLPVYRPTTQKIKT